ncbi:EF-hand calcium-binding domain-containing protein 6-like isoform X2 [Babylonia areolata]|uniref:EF-hand calcium-binding domain-containing protein 6-like isoform X2 n=1 Tax=Babylonia areolata TaxID=304850 RepID=UPI003FD34632
MGVSLPEIQHPMSRMSNPDNLDIRGVSRVGDRPPSDPDMGTGRPLASERTPGRKSAAGRDSRQRKEPAVGAIHIDSIPEGVEVKYGDPGSTRLPVFGSRAGLAEKGEVPPSRASTRLSRASTQARLEIDELEALLRDKVKNNYYEVRKRFKDNDPEGRGNVAKEAFLRILVTVAGRQITQHQSQKLLERMGFKERTVIPFSEFFAHFRDVGQDSDHPQWMDPLTRPDHVVMSAGQVHANLREKARQRFLDLADMIPQMNPGGSGRVMRSEFKQMLQKMNFYLDDNEFEKLWCRYDPSNEGLMDGRKFLNALGIEWRGQSGAVRRHTPDSARSSRTPRRKELERKQQLDVERWLKDKFREGFFNMRQAFDDKDKDGKGVVSFDDFLEVLAEFGLKMEKPLLGAFLSRCSVRAMGKGVPYREFLHRFQDRSETGMVHNVLTDVKHRFNNRPGTEGGDSTLSAMESQLVNMFQRDFLALLGMFKKLDRLGTDAVSQEEFRAAIESRFNLELSDQQFESFLDQVPLDEDGNVLYARFMQQFDTRGQAPSLFAAIPERVDPDAVVLPQGKVPAEGPGAPGSTGNAADQPLPSPLVPDVDGEELHRRRTTQELFKAIKELLTKRFQDVERVFQDLDESNTRRLTQDMMYQLLKRFDIRPEISRGEIRDLWRTFITNTDRTLDYYQFIRHFGFSMKSAAFPNAKLQPPRRGDADYMIRSRKLNCASDMLQDSLRSKIDYLWDDLRKEFQGMDPYNTGFVSREEFREVLIELCVNLSDTELEAILAKFDTRRDNRVSYVEFLKPFASRKQTWRHGNNMLSLLQHPQPELPITDIVEPPQKGLHGITAKLRQKVAGDWKNIRRAFRKLDVSGTGYLSLPEFRSVLKLANVLLDEDEVYHVMTEFDRDLSGKIHYEKFIEETFKPESRRSVRSISTAASEQKV